MQRAFMSKHQCPEAGACVWAARREAQRLLVASRSRPPRQPPAPQLLLACEARLVRAHHVALSGDTESSAPAHAWDAAWLSGRRPVTAGDGR